MGNGFNEYDKEKSQIYVFRWGFPGKNRYIEFFYSFSDLEAIRLENKSQLQWIKPAKLSLYLLLKNGRKILLMRSNDQSTQPIEHLAGDLAQFLRIPLQGSS